MLADHDKFKQLIRDNWGSHKFQNQLRDIWEKCMRLKGPLRELTNKWFVKTSERLMGIRQQLQVVQHNLMQRNTNDLILEEKRLLTELDRWNNIEG